MLFGHKERLRALETRANALEEEIRRKESELSALRRQLEEAQAEADRCRWESDAMRRVSEEFKAFHTSLVQVQGSVGTLAQRSDEDRETVEQAFERAEVSREAAEAIAQSLRQLAERSQSAAQKVGALDARAQEITGIVNLIREIADQTNLLALNAAIEAAQEAFEALAKKDVERMVEAAHRMELASLEVMQGLDRLVEGAEKNAELLACVKGGETARPERAPLSGAPKAAAAPTPPARSPVRSR